MVIKDVIVLKATPTKQKNFYNITSIATNAFNKTPFEKNILIHIENEKPKIGDVIEIKETQVFKDAKIKTTYKIHNYELATVLGKQSNDLLVCGKKINKLEIKNYTSNLNTPWAVFDIKRGNKLLLQEIASGKFAILHNITQEKLYHHAMQNEI